jgi:hypothetical protein
MVGDLGRRAAKEFSGSIIAQVQLPGAAKVEHTGESERSRYRSLECGEAQSKVASGGVSGHAEPLEVEPGEEIILVYVQSTVSAADVLKGARPAATRISYTAILHVPGCDAGFFQRMAKMAGIGEIVFRAPVAAVNKEDHGMRSISRRYSHVNKLIGVLAVRKAQIGVGRLLAENGFALHARQYRTAPLTSADRELVKAKIEQAEMACPRIGTTKFYFGRPGALSECDGAED